MKRWVIIVAAIVAIVFVLILGKNFFAKQALLVGIKAITGLDSQIESMTVGGLSTNVGIKGLKIFNPSEFSDKIMLDMPEIYVDYDLGAFLKQKVHLEEVRLNLKEFVVSKNEEGKLNINSIKVVEQAKEKEKVKEKKGEPKKAPPELKIDLLSLKIGKVIYKDYSKGTPPAVKEYKVNIDQKFKNVTSPQALVGIVLTKALVNTGVAALTDFKLGSLADAAKGVLKGVTKAVSGAVSVTKESAKKATKTLKGTIKKGGQTIKNILPFGKEE